MSVVGDINEAEATAAATDGGESLSINLEKFLKTKQQVRIKLKWNIANTLTIVDWISTSNMMILILEHYLRQLREILRWSTLWSLVISSITSTVSVTQFTVNDVAEPRLSLLIKASIFGTSVLTSLITGQIKVEKIQERIEFIEKTRTKWLDFMLGLTKELQVGPELRTDAVELIKANQQIFNNLNTKNIEVPTNVRLGVSKMLIENIWTKYRTHNQREYQNRQQWMFLCCAQRSLQFDQVKHTRRKLGMQQSTNKLLKNELEYLRESFPDLIQQLKIDNNASDIFDQQFKPRTYKNRGDEPTGPVEPEEEAGAGDEHHSPDNHSMGSHEGCPPAGSGANRIGPMLRRSTRGKMQNGIDIGPIVSSMTARCVEPERVLATGTKTRRLVIRDMFEQKLAELRAEKEGLLLQGPGDGDDANTPANDEEDQIREAKLVRWRERLDYLNAAEQDLVGKLHQLTKQLVEPVTREMSDIPEEGAGAGDKNEGGEVEL